MIKAFFLDFYGTIVHEDGEIVKKISQIIMKKFNTKTPPLRSITEVPGLPWDFPTP